MKGEKPGAPGSKFEDEFGLNSFMKMCKQGAFLSEQVNEMAQRNLSKHLRPAEDLPLAPPRPADPEPKLPPADRSALKRPAPFDAAQFDRAPEHMVKLKPLQPLALPPVEAAAPPQATRQAPPPLEKPSARDGELQPRASREQSEALTNPQRFLEELEGTNAFNPDGTTIRSFLQDDYFFKGEQDKNPSFMEEYRRFESKSSEFLKTYYLHRILLQKRFEYLGLLQNLSGAPSDLNKALGNLAGEVLFEYQKSVKHVDIDKRLSSEYILSELRALDAKKWPQLSFYSLLNTYFDK